MFERGIFKEQKTLHIITKGGGVDPRMRGRFNYDTQFPLDELVDLYPKLHTRRLELDSLLY